jgi:hypothetical protein
MLTAILPPQIAEDVGKLHLARTLLRALVTRPIRRRRVEARIGPGIGLLLPPGAFAAPVVVPAIILIVVETPPVPAPIPLPVPAASIIPTISTRSVVVISTRCVETATMILPILGAALIALRHRRGGEHQGGKAEKNRTAEHRSA